MPLISWKSQLEIILFWNFKIFSCLYSLLSVFRNQLKRDTKTMPQTWKVTWRKPFQRSSVNGWWPFQRSRMNGWWPSERTSMNGWSNFTQILRITSQIILQLWLGFIKQIEASTDKLATKWTLNRGKNVDVAHLLLISWIIIAANLRILGVSRGITYPERKNKMSQNEKWKSKFLQKIRTVDGV